MSRLLSARRPNVSTGRQALAWFIRLNNTSSNQLGVCSSQCRKSSAAAASHSSPPAANTSNTVTIDGKIYQADEWFNVSPTITSSISRKLHLQKDHPISITRSIIESRFPNPTYKHHNNFYPVVSTHQNFDSLGFPPDHPGRSKTDTYYINKETVLRTHTSAHEVEVFRANESEGYLISADVYRRDAVDRSHYPIFHQMEGARMWDRTKVPNGDIAAAVWADFEKLPTHSMKVEDRGIDYEKNPLQKEHTKEEAEAIAAHLKRSLELMVVEIFSRAKKAAMEQDPGYVDVPLEVRWIETYFPHTSPSFELEIFWQGDWLEVLGSGVVTQDVLNKAGVSDQMGWAFGIGLERIAMLLFEIPDIRLFWSEDERFLGQFKGLSEDLEGLRRFVPFSKHPACYMDVSFWLDKEVHENDVMEVVRDIGGQLVEDVRRMDEFTSPWTGHTQSPKEGSSSCLPRATIAGNNPNLMDTSPGGENTQYEGQATFIQGHERQKGQFGGTPSRDATSISQLKSSAEEKERGEKTAENIRYGEAISEHGFGGETVGNSGEAKRGEGFGRAGSGGEEAGDGKYEEKTGV